MKTSKCKILAVITINVLLWSAPGLFAQQGQSQKQSQHAMRDANNDGTCDVCGQPVGSGQANAQGKQAKKGKHWGPSDGSGNQGSGPKDGTGNGSRSGTGMGARDGSGPYHQDGGQGQGRGQGQGQGQGSGRRGGRS